MRDQDAGAILAALGILVACVVLVRACSASANVPVSPFGADEAGQWSPDTCRALSSVAEIESSQRVDQAAIAWSLLRWWRLTRRGTGRTFHAQIVAYSAPMRRWVAGHAAGPYGRPFSPRQRRILTAPSPGVVRLMDAWARGDVPDPCPGAMHWRSRARFERGPKMILPPNAVDCETANLFMRREP